MSKKEKGEKIANKMVMINAGYYYDSYTDALYACARCVEDAL